MLESQVSKKVIEEVEGWSFYPSYILYKQYRDKGSAKYVKRLVKIMVAHGTTVDEAQCRYYEYYPKLMKMIDSSLVPACKIELVKENFKWSSEIYYPDQRIQRVVMNDVSELENGAFATCGGAHKYIVKESPEGGTLVETLDSRTWTSRVGLHVIRQLEQRIMGRVSTYNYGREPAWNWEKTLKDNYAVVITFPVEEMVTIVFRPYGERDSSKFTMVKVKDRKGLVREAQQNFIYRLYNEDGNKSSLLEQKRAEKNILMRNENDFERYKVILKVGSHQVRRSRWNVIGGQIKELVIQPHPNSLSIKLKFRGKDKIAIVVNQRDSYIRTVISVIKGYATKSHRMSNLDLRSQVDKEGELLLQPLEDFGSTYEILVCGECEVEIVEDFFSCAVTEINGFYLYQLCNRMYELAQANQSTHYRIMVKDAMFDIGVDSVRTIMKTVSEKSHIFNFPVLEGPVMLFCAPMMSRLRDEVVKYMNELAEGNKGSSYSSISSEVPE